MEREAQKQKTTYNPNSTLLSTFKIIGDDNNFNLEEPAGQLANIETADLDKFIRKMDNTMLF